MQRTDPPSPRGQEGDSGRWRHDHVFGQDRRRPGETRTLIVIVITATMMVVEVAAGAAFGSMALLADGLHMASHAAALGINAFAYVYARRHAHDDSFSFGTGKINTLGGFTGAVLLAGFALLMVSESLQRLVSPVSIDFDRAILVAVLGLVVNGASMLILGRDHHDHHDHDHDDHDDDHAEEGHHDHNLASAYLHVLADALTSVLAIAALLAAKLFGLTFMDPVMGIVGAALVARWSWGLLRATAAVLLDRAAPPAVLAAIRESLEGIKGTSVVDLHVWRIAPDQFSAQIAIVAVHPQPPEHYKALLPPGLGLVHVAVEIHEPSRPS
jgi:cation diffusion facilitator family transporter